MTTVNQDYPGHARQRRSQSPHLPPIQDSHVHAQQQQQQQQQQPQQQQQQQPQQSQHSQSAVTDAWTDAFARLQQQVQYNTNAVEDQRRHLTELHEVVRNMHSEVVSMWRNVDTISSRLDAQAGQDAKAVKADEGDIDVLTAQLQSVAGKANEVDGLKVQIEILTRRIRRLESTTAPTTSYPPTAESAPYAPHHPSSHQYSHPTPVPSRGQPGDESRQSAHPAPESRPPAPPPAHISEPRSTSDSVPEARSIPGFRPLESSTNVAGWRAAAPHVPSSQEAAPAPRHEVPASSGWAAVNTTHHVKRSASIDANMAADGSVPGSPKRQKLATLMPRAAYGDHPAVHNSPYHSTDPSQAIRPQTGDPAQQANGAQGSMRFVPFPRESNGHEQWRHGDPRGRGDRSYRGGRRSGPGEDDREHKYEGEWREWAASADGYHRHPQHAYAISPPDPHRRREVYPVGWPEHGDGHSIPGQETPSPALTDTGKKSRTKPTRNADGILIRKDGRPDMRSISSAMNLRKVHAKKEAERSAELQGGGSESGGQSRSTPGPTNGSILGDGERHSTIGSSASPRSARELSGPPGEQNEARPSPGPTSHSYDSHTSTPAALQQQQQQRERERERERELELEHAHDTIVVDTGSAQMRERQEKAVEQPRAGAGAEAHAVAV
ncbi:hypothetical protein ANO11243_089370 [Dothideomycetidae sp. 11243]|nr:hypothetical protein ANO11243_089370 [fungal sp. No.11243]